jgi:predicted dehydrogenase
MKASSSTSLISVCAATGSHAQHAARKFGFQTCTSDESEVIHNPTVNAVVIATRHHLHARQVVDALEAGKSVFCEKPLCLSDDELIEICRTYLTNFDSKKPLLMVGFNRRFAAMVHRLRAFLEPISEPLALHYRVNAGYLPIDHWVNDREQGGGRILGEACHFVDLLVFLARSPVVGAEARAVGSSPRYSGDNVLISLSFANGSEGTISYLANGNRSYAKERIEIFGGGSTAVLEDFRRLELMRNGHKETIHSRWRQDKGHRAEWAAFAERVREGSDSPIPFGEIVASTLTTLRVQESLATGRKADIDTASFLDSILRTSA